MFTTTTVGDKKK